MHPVDSRPSEYILMDVDISVKILDVKLFSDEEHIEEFSKLSLKGICGSYLVHLDEVQTYFMTINDIAIYDLRNISINMTNCYLQKQSTDISTDLPVFNLKYHGYPQ